MRRHLALVGVIAVLFTGCSGSRSRSFERYYDPQGLFATDLPAGNDVTETPPQPGASGAPGIVAGVVSQPPQPSPSPTSQLGGGLSNITQQQAPADQTAYEVLAVTTDSFQSLPQMVLYFLTGDPATDVQVEQPWQIAGSDGELVVANATANGQTTAAIAAAFTLGRNGTGYIVAAVFPPGEWDKERSDFEKVIASFSSGVPPGVKTIPLVTGTA
jgi:hypothetical protein